MVCTTWRLALSITETVPPISADTQTWLPSGENSAKRGRASTSTLSVIAWLAVSMKCAMLVVSEVFTSTAPSGLTRSEEHTSELQSLMRISYAVLCLKKKTKEHSQNNPSTIHPN